MLQMDIVYVSYNSEKWIDGCFNSLEKSDYDLKNINIYVIDNKSTDRSVELLKEIKTKIGYRFDKFEVIESEENLGFWESK